MADVNDEGRKLLTNIAKERCFIQMKAERKCNQIEAAMDHYMKRAKEKDIAIDKCVADIKEGNNTYNVSKWEQKYCDIMGNREQE